MFSKIPATEAQRIEEQFLEAFDTHLENGNYRLAFTVFIIAMRDLKLSSMEYRVSQKRRKLSALIRDYNFACEIQNDINSL